MSYDEVEAREMRQAFHSTLGEAKRSLVCHGKAPSMVLVSEDVMDAIEDDVEEMGNHREVLWRVGGVGVEIFDGLNQGEFMVVDDDMYLRIKYEAEQR